MGLSDHPAGATAQDVDRFVENVQLATPYFTTITPGDFEANREMIRRMYAYVMALEMLSGKNPRLRPLASRARRAMNGFPIGYGTIVAPRSSAQGQEPEQPVVPPKPEGPPFAMAAPDVEGAPAELTARYDSTAARASVAWQNAETLRAGLESRGMTLNAQTAASLGRLEVDMDAALRAFKGRKWAAAADSLDRADGEIAKISKIAGK